ncbi:ubiquitin thioesterase otu1 [Fusarium longipes]|uniref:Ubiquitin thioesterase OTU n=1 Tax=Fusarium longipes TaxID=694270 RepID=A0A395SHE8_9HYPO|nr:ubiquitin thioesterase otu1 [Fusarium longipes]
MRARFKGPAGTGILDLSDDATVQVLFDEIRTKTGISKFSVRYGPPMAMKSLEGIQGDQNARSLGLHGETLTIVPEESPPAPTEDVQTGTIQHQVMASGAVNRNESPEDVNVPWPQREGTLYYILQHPEEYSEAVLGSPPSQYCRSIQDPDRWGGGIELSILSSVFDIQICTFDVQTQSKIEFGEEKRDRCILLYSGIHYDRVAFSCSDPPYTSPTLPPELDQAVWSTTDDEVLKKTEELVQKLNKAHYYTDTDGLILRCDVPGCDWIGSGQLEGQRHAEATGHVDLSEIQDEGDSILRKCDAPGCDFIGQGDKVVGQHRADTTHQKFSVIHDA